ncbi:MAG: hypothetical protein IPJ98_03825 [Bryobacterales bacterium]|nr:hypothetical protein [Bryobacterales bacterium]
MRRVVCFAMAGLLAASAAVAQVAVTNEDVVKLAKSGLSEEFILDMVKKQPSKLSGEPSKLIELKQAGVSERVIEAVSERSPSALAVTQQQIRELAAAGFQEQFLLGYLERNPGKMALDTAGIVELKQAGVSERVLAAMVGKPAAAKQIPSGTEIGVQMIDSIDSRQAKEGDEFRASLIKALVVNEEEIAPKGADAVVKLVTEKEAGKFSGRTELTVALTAIMVGGKKVELTTASVQQESGSQTAKTAKTAAGVGAVGALIGAIAGGGKGAAIGAAAGAGAGAGAQVFMKGQRVRIPSETTLYFTTDAAAVIP